MGAVTHALRLLAALALAGCYDGHDLDGGRVKNEKYGVHGLITDPSPAQVKDGALSTAHNVAFRRMNMAEPRPGFTIGLEPPLDEVWKLVAYDGGMLIVGDGEAEAGTRTYWGSDLVNSVKDENATNLSWTNPYIRGAVARKNLYLATDDAVRKVTSAGDLVAEITGVSAPIVTVTANGAGTLLQTNTQAAYRATVERTDANGVVTLSPPSGRAIVSNSGAACAGSVIVILSDEHNAGDVVRVWRSTVVTTSLPTPSDDLRLVWEHVLTAADVAPTYATVSVQDDLADAARGAALYTNPTREGIERQNIAPPRSRDLALYQGSLFSAGVVFPPSLEFSWTEGSSSGPNTRAKDSTRTNGSANIVVANTTGLEVGQLLEDSRTSANWSGTGTVRITAIVATTLTMSETWSGATDGAPVSLNYVDTIRVKTASEDVYYKAGTATDFLIGVNARQTASGVVGSDEVRASAVNDLLKNAGATFVAGRRTVRLQTILPSHAGFEVFATHGSSYEPVLPAPTEANGYDSVATSAQNGLSWSKTDQPDHFLLSALWYVGVETSPILRIIPTRDSLIILKGKGDGIYRLTGFGERSGWRVDPIDTDTYLLHPELALETDGRVFAWTNKGMVEVTDAGVSPPLNSPIANLTAEQERTLDGVATAFFAFCAANTKDSELIFGMPASDPATDEGVDEAYVFNTRTQSWSTWFDASAHMTTLAYEPGEGLLYYGLDNSGDARVERAPSATIINADSEVSISITAINTSTNQLTYTGTYTAALGDLIKAANGQVSHVTATVDSTHCIVQSVGTMNTGAATAYVAFSSTLTWQPDTGGSSTAWKRYQEQVLHWDDVYGLHGWGATFNNEVNSSALSYTRTLDRTNHRRMDTRALPPRSVALARHMSTGLTVTSADARWRVTGVGLIAEAGSMRATR